MLRLKFIIYTNRACVLHSSVLVRTFLTSLWPMAIVGKNKNISRIDLASQSLDARAQVWDWKCEEDNCGRKVKSIHERIPPGVCIRASELKSTPVASVRINKCIYFMVMLSHVPAISHIMTVYIAYLLQTRNRARSDRYVCPHAATVNAMLFKKSIAATQPHTASKCFIFVYVCSCWFSSSSSFFASCGNCEHNKMCLV